MNLDWAHWSRITVKRDNPHHTHIAPIYQTSTFAFPDVQTGADIYAGKNDGFVYTRVDNPNARQLAKKLAALEGIDLLEIILINQRMKLLKGACFHQAWQLYRQP